MLFPFYRTFCVIRNSGNPVNFCNMAKHGKLQGEWGSEYGMPNPWGPPGGSATGAPPTPREEHPVREIPDPTLLHLMTNSFF